MKYSREGPVYTYAKQKNIIPLFFFLSKVQADRFYKSNWACPGVNQDDGLEEHWLVETFYTAFPVGKYDTNKGWVRP